MFKASLLPFGLISPPRQTICNLLPLPNTTPPTSSHPQHQSSLFAQHHFPLLLPPPFSFLVPSHGNHLARATGTHNQEIQRYQSQLLAPHNVPSLRPSTTPPQVPPLYGDNVTESYFSMAFSQRMEDAARGILVDHIKKTYELNAFSQAWRNLPEIPSSAEIKPADYKDPALVDEDAEERGTYQQEKLYDNKLPHNIVDGPWPSKEAYLGAHYQIIREDAIASLRNAVAEVQHTPSMEETHGTLIYTSVTFTGLLLSRLGVASRVEFSCNKAGKRIRWEASKRLAQGTIVALSPENDMFKTICKVATVAARPIEGGLKQDPPTIDLFWGDIDDLAFDPVEKYVMVESKRGYFEASRHTLVAMQKLMTEKFSFAKELVELNPSVDAPLYVQQDPFMDLTSLQQSARDRKESVLAPSSAVSTPLYSIDVLGNFPKKINGGMDHSQVSACETMLTKRIAIVQGPPGTGKTFVSVSALEVMIRKLGPFDPPIIVAAQTNHALDQLLNHIMVFEPEIVRLGGRSDRENVAIKTRTLYELSKATDTSSIGRGLGPSRRQHQALIDEVKGVLLPLSNNELITADALLDEDIITEEQRRSLDSAGWAVEQSNDSVPTDDLEAWLTDAEIMPIEGAPHVNFGLPLEESDIEAEQLLALAQEAGDCSGLEDKENDFGLLGDWVAFGRKFTGRHNSAVVDSSARRQLSRCKNLYEIPSDERGRMYRYFEKQMNNILMRKLQEVLVRYQSYVEDNKVTKSLFHIKLLQLLDIKVIGCTTTGLSKYRGFLSALQPRTLLIEEAAETLESKVVAGMMESLQQLILVGDHKQLQASCTVPALQVEPYNLNISMFERLVGNGMPFVMLNHQRRMIPDIRKLLCIPGDPFYTDLYDHESVLDRVKNRPPVPGMGGKDTYFFSHNWAETKSAEGSRYNLDEADMIVEFFHYLVLNGVDAKKISILSFYNGQRKTIIRELRRHPSLASISYFNVFTVDSYQGEENDIILLSMVRSNQALGVGFLDNRNRLVVALSRARQGLYLFGNSMTLVAGEESDLGAGRDPLFGPLTMFMQKQGRYDIDGGLPITCSQHHKKIKIYEPVGWDGLAGGCDLRCEWGALPCGHTCNYRCHPFDHSQIICRQACLRHLPCGHGCSRNCWEPCVCNQCQARETFKSRTLEENTSPAWGQSPANNAPETGGAYKSGHGQIGFDKTPSRRQGGFNQGGFNKTPSRQFGFNQGGFNKTPSRQFGFNEGGLNKALSHQGRFNERPNRQIRFSEADGRRQGGSNEAPNPYSVSDVRRDIHSLNSGPPEKTGFGRGTNSNANPGQSFPRRNGRFDLARQPPQPYRAMRNESVINKNHPGIQDWANFSAETADREAIERERKEAADKPKVESSPLVFKDTYRQVIVKDGVRTLKQSGTIRTLIPREHADAFAETQTALTPTVSPDEVSPEKKSASNEDKAEGKKAIRSQKWSSLYASRNVGSQQQIAPAAAHNASQDGMAKPSSSADLIEFSDSKESPDTTAALQPSQLSDVSALGTGLPVRPSSTHKSLLDEPDVFSSSAQKGEIDESDDLISF